MTDRTQPGFSSAAVPMLTRAQPVPSARDSESSSLMPPDISTAMSSLRTTRREQVRVRAAAERGVQVHQVDPRCPGPLPGQRRLQRVAVVSLAAGRPLDQPHRAPVRDVHRGQQDQIAHRVPSQLESSTAPASPDFSGWNWVADTTPCSAAAANCSPCSVQEMSAPARVSSPAPPTRSA